MATPKIGERLFRGYGPLIGLAAMFTAMAMFVPSVKQEVRSEIKASSSSDSAVMGATTSVVPGDETTVAPTDTAAVAGDATTTGGGTGSAGTGSGAKSSSKAGAATNGGGPGVTSAAPAIAPCPGRQVPADPYSPPCIKFTGSNGGATSMGVTADSITVAVRIQAFSSGLVDAVAQAAGADFPKEDEGVIRRTIEGLVDFFNSRYQFYGRKLNLQIYSGRGDVLQEILGGGQEGAQNDALKVGAEIKAFADVSAITPPYIDGLVNQKVIAIGAPYMSSKWMGSRAPYVWSPLIDCSSIVENETSYYLGRMNGKPAVNAGGALASQPRKLGIVVPDTPWYNDCKDQGLATLAKGGVNPVMLKYVPSLTSMTTAAASLLPQLQSSGVTTVACFCDPLLMSVLLPQASKQQYFPEWLNTGVAFTDQDLVAQLFAPDQWKRSIGLSYSGPSAPQGRGVGYQAYKSVRKDEPSIGVDLIYSMLQVLAIGIQGAGPDLTPDHFQSGMFNYPVSQGALGTWKFGPGDYTTSQDSREIYWDPNRTSVQTNKPGAYVETQPGKRYPIGGFGDGSDRIPGLG